MSDKQGGLDCGRVREQIPDYVAGALDAEQRAMVESHARACAACRAELELAQVLFDSRPAVPAALIGRLERAVAADRPAPTRTWWGLSAAAIAALALGIGISSSGAPEAATDVPGYAYEADEGEIWLSDDGLLAGAPALGELSDEALLELLDELSTGSGGGTA